MLRTILAELVLALYLPAVGLPLLVGGWLAGTVGPLYPATVAVLRLCLRVAGVRLRIDGRENIAAGTCLFMANHTSAVDPVAVLIAIPRRVAFLAKQELFRIPFLGTAMRLARFIPVDRTSREAAVASAERAVEQLRQGVSMMIYPEGTRSADGRLGPFKRGGFLIAILAGVPVTPVTIIGAERVMARGGLWLHPGEIRVQFHPPIAAGAYRPEDRDQLRDRVRAAIASALPLDLS